MMYKSTIRHIYLKRLNFGVVKKTWFISLMYSIWKEINLLFPVKIQISTKKIKMNEYFLGCYTPLTLFQLAAVHDKSDLLPTSFHCSFSQNVPSSSSLFGQIPCRILHSLAFSLKLDLFFFSIISYRSSDCAACGFVCGSCRRNGTDDPKKHCHERTRRLSVKNRSPKAMWTSRRAERVQPFEFTPLSDRDRTAVGPKSDGTRRVSTWVPRLAGLNGADPRLVGIGWRWRWRHYIDCPAHATPRGFLKIALFLSSCPSLCHPFHPLACRSTGLGKKLLAEERKIFLLICHLMLFC